MENPILLSRDSHNSQLSAASSSRHSGSSMSSLIKKLSKRSSKASSPASSRSAAYSDSTNPFFTPMPTRRPPAARPRDARGAPPPYSAAAAPYSPADLSAPVQVAEDSPYSFLSEFDTVFLIDDSGSMAGRSCRETSAAIAAIAPICTTYDADGIDIYFLNHRNPNSSIDGYTNVTTTEVVQTLFQRVRPLGGTPTGTRLNHILKPYLAEVAESMERQAHGREATVKPLNIIVITDGVPTDDVESVIVTAAKKLDSFGAEPWQVGIQFFQVGREPEAAENLRELDDALSEQYHIRDMVDTVPWGGEEGAELTAQGLLKVCLGSVVRRLDRRAV